MYLNPSDIKNLVIFFLISSSVFIFGFLDDRNNIKASIKSLIFLIIVFLFLPLDQNLIVRHLDFKSLIDQTIILNQGSFFFTIFCLFLFFNAVNFSDGANGVSISLGIYWLSIIIFKSIDYNLIYLTLFFSLILLFLFNLKNKLMVPGLDMVRVTIERNLEKKSPLVADKSHLHHYLMKTFDQDIVWVPYLLISILPLIILEISNSSVIAIFTMSVLYLIIIVYYKKKEINKLQS